MKNSWLISALIVGVVIIVLVLLNHQGNRETIPLSDLFQDEEKTTHNVEYEFVGKENQTVKTTPPVVNVAIPATSPKVSVSPPASEPKSSTTTAVATKSIFTVQVASFKDKPKADKTLEEVKKIDPTAYMVTKNLGEKGTWYRLYAGKFETKEEAQDLLSKFSGKFPNSFIMITK